MVVAVDVGCQEVAAGVPTPGDAQRVDQAVVKVEEEVQVKVAQVDFWPKKGEPDLVSPTPLNSDTIKLA